jgi:uncharacterized membrane protein YkoI
MLRFDDRVGRVRVRSGHRRTSAPVKAVSAPAPAKAAAAKPAEGKLKLEDLPAPVKATVEAETKHATVKGLSREKENGKTVYEPESIVDGRTRDLMIDAAGKVYVVEEQLDVNQAPAPVKTAMEARGQIVKLEAVTENGKRHYEGQIRNKAGKTVAMELDPDGKPIRR